MEPTRKWVGSLRLVRATRFQAIHEPTPLRCARDVYNFMKPHAEREDVENFWMLALDAQHRVMRDSPILVTLGILNSSLIHPREVFRAAIVLNAYAIILVHNHPSGDPNPSSEDRAVTTQLSTAGKLIGIDVLDHLILGHGRFVSFAESGLL